MNFTAYRHHADLDTEGHVREIARLLAPFGLDVDIWPVGGEERDRQAVEDRLGAWADADCPSGRGNSLLYWVGHGSAGHLAHHRTPAPIRTGVSPVEVADAIGSRQLHPANEDSWAIVVLDACFSRDFAIAVHLHLLQHHGDAGRYLLLSTAARGPAELGGFTRALERALTSAFPERESIGLAELGQELARDLAGYRADTTDDRRDRLVNRETIAAFSSSLDQLAELRAVVNELPTDERRHFVPKASGAELGELAWYFHGRTLQRDRILRWLDTATHGALVVTGPAGAGKSALLGHVLLHTRSDMRDILIRHGHLTALPPGTPCPDDPFDLTAHLAGHTLHQTIQLVADAAGLPRLARIAAQGRPPADLAGRLITELRDRPNRLTLLFDALDEADQPVAIAESLLRPLAALPGVRLVIGTRRSTREGPDHPSLADTDLLDILRLRPTGSGTATGRPLLVEVGQDPEALAGYLRAKLTTAKHRGDLDADDTTVASAVHRLVSDHPQRGGEPQQFLYARLAVHELLNNPALVIDPAPLIGRTHRQLFTLALERLHHLNPHYTLLLRALGLAQGRGLPVQDGIWSTIAGALATDPTDTRESIPGLLRDAAPYLALDQEHGQSVYRLAHRTFTEHLTTVHDSPRSHAAVTTALIHDAAAALEPLSTRVRAGDGVPQAAVSPYIRHHLAAHARLGHTSGALHTLGGHPGVLDALDLTSITTAVFGHGLPARDLPPSIAGAALLQHHARDTTSEQQADATAMAWRRWWRRLGTTCIQGTAPPVEPALRTTGTWIPDLVAGSARRRSLQLQLTGHTKLVRSVAAFTAPDGTPRLATGSHDGTVRVWDPVTGTQIGEPLTGHTDWVIAMTAFAAPDGTPRLATGGSSGTVRIWDPATGTQIGEPLTGHTDWVRSVAAFAAPDGTPRLATGGSDKTVRIWDPATGAQVGEPLTGHIALLAAVAVFTAPDGTPRLATGSGDGTVRIWDPATGAQVGEPLTGHTYGVHAAAVFTAPDGTPRLATAGGAGTVRIWDPATGTQIGEPLTGNLGSVKVLAVFAAPNGAPRLAVVSGDGTVRIWDPVTGAQIGKPLAGHTHSVWSMTVFNAPDGTPRLATAEGTTVRIWDPADELGAPQASRTQPMEAVAVFSAPDGTPRLATAEGATVRIWDLATNTPIGEPLTGHNAWVAALAVFSAPDGTPRLASGDDDGVVRIWDPATGTRIGEPLTGHTYGVWSEAVFTAPDGTPRLATAGNDGTVRIWDPATGTQVGPPLTGHKDYVNALAVFTAPDGTPRLASGGDDGTVRIWDPATGTQVGPPLTGHRSFVKALTVFTTPDGTPRLASSSSDKTVRIWDPATGTQVGPPLTGHSGPVEVVAAFTAPNGAPLIASGDDDETMWVWDPTTGSGTVLPLAAVVHSLTASRGLLVAGTNTGFLCLDTSSVNNLPASIELGAPPP
ncbi:hypothetical protein ACFWOG_03465 [Kitasatospora sp. NPDC058406]|uniref:hypothetical protein n=1 Tax=Kitasatospora sp. NPDC058406 TaxID=3346483 RepID=UPI0036643236